MYCLSYCFKQQGKASYKFFKNNCNKKISFYTNKVKGGKVMQNMEEIYNKYSKIVYKYIFCLTGKKEIAEEIVQETFLVAIENIDKFEYKCKLSTWLCQIAKYIWFNRYRKEKKRKEISMNTLENTLFTEESIEEIVSQKEEKLELLKNIQKLNEETRNVMYLRILGNLEYEEIGEIMGKTSNWARVTFFRGKQKMKGDGENEKGM